MQANEYLGRVLVERGVVTQAQLDEAEAEQARTKMPAFRVLVQRGHATEEDLYKAQIAAAMTAKAAPVAQAQPQVAAPVDNGTSSNGHASAPPPPPPPGVAVEASAPAPMQMPPPAAADLVAPAPAETADDGAAGELEAALSEVNGSPGGPEELFGVAPESLPMRRPTLDAALVAAASGGGNGHGSSTFDDTDLAMVEVEAPEPEPEPDELKDPNLADFLLAVMDADASDLHMTAGLPPMIRVYGDLRPLRGYRAFEAKDLQEIIYSILTQKQREKFEENMELDLSYALPGKARFRVNVFQQRDALGAVMRRIPFEIKSLDALGLPPAVREFAKLRRGLVLVTGITGSGKSTTLAGLIDIVNSERAEHIMTVEDPIEFLHRHKKAIVNQREVGTDTQSFAKALKHALRQDPDVILVGEMRDLETIQTALTAAETGHVVFGTLHTQDAPQSVDRIIDVFPPHQQEQIRVQLAGALAGVVSQQLLPRPDGKGRAVAAEVLVANAAIRNLIREGKTYQIYTLMQAGGKYGMQVMDQHLADLVKKNVVTYEMALERCHKVEEFNRLVGKG